MTAPYTSDRVLEEQEVEHVPGTEIVAPKTNNAANGQPADNDIM
jgi:hypothetical protein